MIYDIRFAITLSLVAHLGLFALTTMHNKKILYVTMPVELFFYNAPAPVAPPVAVPKEEEIVIPKKVIEKKKEPPKKEEPKKTESVPKESPATEPLPAHTRPLVPSTQISLDTARFPYAYYTGMIVKKISRQWQWSVEFGSLRSVVYFVIKKDGTLAQCGVSTPSGDRLFDQQAERSVQLAAPFPPLPTGYEEDTLGVYFEFSFKE